MAAGWLSRFKLLERSRREAAPEAPTASAGRFEALETGDRTGSPAQPEVAWAGTGSRVAEEPGRAAPVASGLELAPDSPDDQPFIRCMRCEGDSHAFATACAHCGASLETPQQRAFNEQLWARQRAEKAQEEQLLAQRRDAAHASMLLERAEGRALAEQMAREVGEETRRHLEAGEHFDFPAELFHRLGPRSRAAALAAAFAVPVLLATFPSTRFVGLGLVVALFLAWVRAWLRQ